jgi:dTDP-4-amino-4,6-dideoxygalactose transaminase
MSTAWIETSTRELAAFAGDLLAEPTALRGPLLRGSGPVARFESLLAHRCGFPFCLATCNATTALLALGVALQIRGKQVVVPPASHCWAGSIGPFQMLGAELIEAPVSVDGTLDPQALAVQLAKMQTPPVAVLAVDWQGSRHDASGIREVCQEMGTLYVEDTSWLPGRSAPLNAPSIADVQVMSFGPGKPLCLGEGGAVLVRDPNLYARLVAACQHPERWAREGIAAPDYPMSLNGRIHPFAAILGEHFFKSNDEHGA